MDEGKREKLKQTLVAVLSRDELLAVILRYYEKLTEAEIAIVLEVTPERGVAILREAKRKMRVAIGEI